MVYVGCLFPRSHALYSVDKTGVRCQVRDRVTSPVQMLSCLDIGIYKYLNIAPFVKHLYLR